MKNLYVPPGSKNERGIALITSLLFLVLLTVLGLAVVMMSNTDMFISRNDATAKKAIYVADAATQQAMANLNTMAPTGLSNWSSVQPSIPLSGNPNSSIKYSIKYKIENENGDDRHVDSSAPAHSIVYYDTDHRYSSSPYHSNGPAVFTIKATGKVPGGGTATVVADVSKYAFNVIPPGAYYSGGPLNMDGDSSIQSKTKNPDGTSNDNAKKPLPVYSSPAGPASIGGNAKVTDDGTQNTTPNTGANATFRNMTGAHAYLGDLGTLQNLASQQGHSYTYTYNSATGTGSWNTLAGTAPKGPWGSGHATASGGYVATAPTVVYIDASQCPNSTFDLNADSGAAGSYCLFVVKGNLDVSGNTGMDGLIYVTGDLTMRGTGNGAVKKGDGEGEDEDDKYNINDKSDDGHNKSGGGYGGGSGGSNVSGSGSGNGEDDGEDNEVTTGQSIQWNGGIMAGGTTTITGNTHFSYNYDALVGLQNYFGYRILDWQRQYSQ